MFYVFSRTQHSSTVMEGTPRRKSDVNLEVVSVHGTQAKRGSRMSLRLSPNGEQQFRAAIKAMVDSMMADRRKR